MEKTFVKKAVAFLGKQPSTWVYKVVATPFSRRGVPDIICCVHGQFLAIECKADGGDTSKSQDHELAQLHKAGAVTMIAFTMKGVEDAWKAALALAYREREEE